MSNVLKLSGPIRVGLLSGDPVNPTEGYIYFNTTDGVYRFYENGAFRNISVEQLQAHLDSGASKHDADQIDYERADGLKKNISAGSDNVESAISDLDDSIGELDATPTNYTPADPGIVADHLAAIDLALATSGSTEFSDAEFRIQDNSDPTKQIAFEASGVGTGVTRTITMPNADVNLGQIATNTSDISNNTTDISNLQTLSGRPDGSTDLGTFTGSTISDSNSVKGALQELETSLETKASVAYVDSVVDGFSPKKPVRAASTVNINLSSPGSTIDGVTMVSGDRFLAKDQTNTTENGIYIWNGAASAATRSTDFDELSPIDEISGAWTSVQEGTSNRGKVFVQYGTVTTIGTDPITFTVRNVTGDFIGGDGIDITGNTISAKYDNSTIGVNGSDQLEVKDGGITNAKVATGLDAAKLGDGSVSNDEFQRLDGVTSNIQTQINGKLSNVVEDTTPQLGGDLDVLDKAVESSTSEVILAGQNSVRRAKQSTKANFIEEEYIHTISLGANQTNVVIGALTVPHATVEGLEITYKIKNATSNNVRIGTLRVVTNGTNIAFQDMWTETADTGISFDAVINGTDIQVRYTSGANSATMRVDVKKIKA